MPGWARRELAILACLSAGLAAVVLVLFLNTLAAFEPVLRHNWLLGHAANLVVGIPVLRRPPFAGLLWTGAVAAAWGAAAYAGAMRWLFGRVDLRRIMLLYALGMVPVSVLGFMVLEGRLERADFWLAGLGLYLAAGVVVVRDWPARSGSFDGMTWRNDGLARRGKGVMAGPDAGTRKGDRDD